jgi:hypothetical protein
VATYLQSVLQLRKALGLGNVGHSRAAEAQKRAAMKAIEIDTLSTIEADDDNLLRTTFN